jgi:hypothetical protein
MKNTLHPEVHKIALAAGGSHYPDVNSGQLATFAELLITECMRVSTMSANQNPPALVEIITGQRLAATLIGEHFGVVSHENQDRQL